MFSNTFQSGFITVFYSVGSSPLSLWDKQVKNGHIRRVIDDEVKSLVLEISGTNVATTYITCPIKPRASLSIRLPFLVMIVKNMKKYFTFEIQILDDKDMHRRFRVSNFQSTTKVRPFCTTMPIGLSSGWNQIQFNLADFTRRAYGTLYLETMRVQVHANVRIRRIYFADRLYSEDEMPSEYRLFVPLSTKKDSKEKASDKMPSDFGKMVKPAEKAASAGATAELAAEPTAAPPSPVESPGEEVQIKVEELEGEKESVVTEAKQEAPPKEEAAGEKAETEAAEGAEEASPGGDVPPSEEAPTTEGEEGEEGEEAAGDTTAGEEATEPAATTEETTAEAPGEAPAEAPAEVPAEAPAEASAEAPAEAPTETPAETPAEATAEDPAEAPAETAAIEGGDEGGEEKPAE